MVLAQPGPQGRMGIVRRGRGGLVSLGGTVFPGHAASEPLADPQDPLKVANGRAPMFRA